MLVKITSVTHTNGEKIKSVQFASEHTPSITLPVKYYGYALITTVSGKEYYIPTLDGKYFILSTSIWNFIKVLPELT